MKGKSTASSNWLVLQKQLAAEQKKKIVPEFSRKKRRKLNELSLDESNDGSQPLPSESPQSSTARKSFASLAIPDDHASQNGNITGSNKVDTKVGEERGQLQQMVLGHQEYTPSQRLPGKYLSLDCEMVGVGLDGSESSLARVSLVNFYGAVILDEFVRQRERVVDYRTQWSGIRDTDMVHAKPFEEIQKQVAELLKDRILVGHAVHNDLKALLLSHPRPLNRDTQFYAYKFGLCKTKKVALRNLVKDQLGLSIQSGEHSSVTDARATMAVYRLHKKEWEKGTKQLLQTPRIPTDEETPGSKRKTPSIEDEDVAAVSESPTEVIVSPMQSRQRKKKSSAFSSGGKRGVSSGLSTVIRRYSTGDGDHAGAQGHGFMKNSTPKTKPGWWKELPSAGSDSKGSIQFKKP